jgi:hypothetical protein
MTITVAHASTVAPEPLLFKSTSLITSLLARATLGFLAGLVVPRSMLTYFEKEIHGVAL